MTTTTDLAAQASQLRARALFANEQAAEHEQALAADLTSAQAARLTALSDAFTAARTLRTDWIIAELCTRLPEMAGTISEIVSEIETAD
jgi:hypothetical protein